MVIIMYVLSYFGVFQISQMFFDNELLIFLTIVGWVIGSSVGIVYEYTNTRKRKMKTISRDVEVNLYRKGCKKEDVDNTVELVIKVLEDNDTYKWLY